MNESTRGLGAWPPAPVAPGLPLTFRQEVVPHLYRALRAGWSCALVGLPGVGLSNVLRFMAEPRVAAHHLEAAPGEVLVVFVEGDQLLAEDECLTVLARQLGAAARRAAREGAWPRADEAALRSVAERAADPGLALVDALEYLCRLRGRQVLVLLDEFDRALVRLGANDLRALRSLRDEHKYHLAYLAGTAHDPAELLALRASQAGPAGADPGPAKFAELLEQHTFPLRPYSPADAHTTVVRKSAGWDEPPTPEQQDQLYRATGGHARLLVAALICLASRRHLPWPNVERALAEEAGVQAGCRALWEGLPAGEQAALWLLAHERPGEIAPALLRRLQLRGLAVGGPPFVFSSLFERFVLEQPAPPTAPATAPASYLRDPEAQPHW